jgi:hypothetical protein
MKELLRVRLRLVLEATLAMPAALGACGGQTVATAGVDATAPGACTTQPVDASTLTGCAYVLPVSGNVETCGLPIGQSLDSASCAALCHRSTGCELYMSNGLQVECQLACPVARRTEGLALSPSSHKDSLVGGFFAHMAALEAASVDAFALLAAELAAHGAPLPLVGRARHAARDEARHASLVRDLASRFGATSRGYMVERGEVRTLERVAAENAAEGCVRETYGALVAMWQARFARHAFVREAMQHIARDETRHAQLAWDIASWVEPKLGGAARRHVDDARRQGVAALRSEVERDAPEEIVRAAGVPFGGAGRALFEQAHRALWTT